MGEALFWYASWPVVIWLAYKFVRLNFKYISGEC